MKTPKLVIAGMVLVAPMVVNAEGMSDFLEHTNEVIALEKQIAIEGHYNQYVIEMHSEPVESVEETHDLVIEVVPKASQNESSEPTEAYESVPKVADEVAEVEEEVQEVQAEVPVIEEQAPEVEVEAPSHNHATEATCYKCDLPLIHCGCESANPTIVTCDECGLDELHCVCHDDSVATCQGCGLSVLECECETPIIVQ